MVTRVKKESVLKGEGWREALASWTVQKNANPTIVALDLPITNPLSYISSKDRTVPKTVLAEIEACDYE